jgi:tetratricopeptide (TPR) repeat protein
MIHRFKVRSSQTLLLVVALLVCGTAGTAGALAQKLPDATERERKNKPASSRRDGRPKPQPAPAAPKTSVSVESGNFVALGNDFRKQKKWKAAEAAYKEAVKVWPANVDALWELGLLYLDRNRMDEAQQTYTELRLLNATYASNLLAEINRRKSILAH